MKHVYISPVCGAANTFPKEYCILFAVARVAYPDVDTDTSLLPGIRSAEVPEQVTDDMPCVIMNV